MEKESGLLLRGQRIAVGLETSDAVEHPCHYTGGKIEVWDFIIDQKMNYLEGNICKYLCRYKSKNGLEDLLKCKAYLEKLIASLQES